jgi:pimeloyl-ACP methyl ester carboxylesterase
VTPLGIGFRCWIIAVSVTTLLSSCSLKVRVEDDWNSFHRKPVPLSGAVETWRKVRSGEDPGSDSLAEYNSAVRGAVVQIAKNWSANEARLERIEADSGSVDLRVNSFNVSQVGLIDEVIPADFVRVRRGFSSETSVDGLGTSLLVRQPRSEEDPMIPATGMWYPVTAILNLDEPTSPVLELIDPTKQGQLRFNGQEFPLTADYSAAFARDFQDRQLQFNRLAGLLHFNKYADRIGLNRVTSLDGSKEPCIFIHGIYSSPSTWDETINQLYQSPEIRERYELWNFGYPTGAPIPYMASEFRGSIREMLEFRRRNGATDQKITIVGHSMGGLLTKVMTMSSGDEEWQQLFNVPIEDLEVSDQDREILRKMIYFEPIPEISTVIFCATPHGGSKLAENPGAKLISDLIEMPAQLAMLSAEIINQSSYALTPLGLELARDRTSSIDQLGSQVLSTVQFFDKPLNPAVRYYSIIGNRGDSGTPPEKRSDGVVRYESAHIEGVESELVVNHSPHGVHRTQGGINEIARILTLR